MVPQPSRLAAAIIAAVGLLTSTVAAGATPADADSSGAATPIARVGEAGFLVSDGDTLWLVETVEIVGSRVPATLSGLVRQVRVLDDGDLEGAPAGSVAEALQAVPGVIVGQRQQYGVQGDLTMRGSTFDQVLVLVDGVAAGDPQTGHYQLDLPMSLADVERLEILPGHGSALYGAGAFGGTLNVVTRPPAARTGGPDPFRYSACLDLRLDWTPPGGWFAGLLPTNALDRERQEIPGVSLPGNLLTSTLGRRF